MNLARQQSGRGATRPLPYRIGGFWNSGSAQESVKVCEWLLILLYVKVELGQKLLLMNPTTWDEQKARVVHPTPSSGGLTHVGIEFMSPAPGFWPINKPLDDWNIAPIATRDSAALRTS